MRWWKRKQREHDLDRELKSHLDLETEEQQREGTPAGDARLAARRVLGNATLVKERTRETWGWTRIESLWKDTRFALRMLRKNPGFAAITVLALGLGVGVNTAVFSLFNSLLLRPLPFPEPDRLARMWDTYGSNMAGPVSYPNFTDWRSWNRTFEDMAVFSYRAWVLTGTGDPLLVRGVAASANLFRILRVQPMLGRNFFPEEERPNANGTDAIIVSHKLWKERFGGDPAILGRGITLSGHLFSIVGVMPAGFDSRTGIENPDFWTTIAPLAQSSPTASRPVTEERSMSFLRVIGRLKAGVSIAQAQADMDRVASLLVRTYPLDDPKAGVYIQGLQESDSGDTRPTLLLLLGAAGVVLLIACADVGGLVLARATRRQREMALRAAIGASRWRIVRQLLVESLVLTTLGCAVGLWLATAASELLARALRLGQIAGPVLDGRVLGFAVLIATAAALIFSLAPVLYAVKTDLIDGLKQSASSTSSTRGQGMWHSALIVGQIALAMVLLSSSALLALSLLRLQRVDLGFDPRHVLTFPVSLPPSRYPQSQWAPFFEQLLARLRSLPGVVSAGAGGSLPLQGNVSRTMLDMVSGTDIPIGQRTVIVYGSVTTGYFRALGAALKRGRDFTNQDTAQSAPVVVINETAARQYFGSKDPLGQQIEPGMWNGAGSTTKPRTIVGVVADVKLESVPAGAPPIVYWPIAQVPCDGTVFVMVRTTSDPNNLIAAVRAELHALEKDLPLYDVQPLDRYVSASLARPRDTAALVSLFTLLALTLTAVGLYGVIAYSVARRTREIGVRIALGAEPRNLLRAVVLRGLSLGLLGAAIGLPAAIAVARLYRTMLYGVSPQEPATLAAGAAVLIIVALVASYVPARRAASVDPMVALRYQ